MIISGNRPRSSIYLILATISAAVLASMVSSPLIAELYT